MNFEIKKPMLQAAIHKASQVSTKALKADFDQANRICIVAEEDRIVFYATNGHLDYQQIIKPDAQNCLSIKQTGKVIVQAKAADPVAAAIGGSKIDAIIQVKDDSDSLEFRNLNTKYKEYASIETFQKFKEFEISKPQKTIATLSMNTVDAVRWIKSVLPYASKRGYKLRYQMLCVHLSEDQTRFVCGDGARFSVMTTPLQSATEAKLLLPQDQMEIILDVVNDSKILNLLWEDRQTCYLSTDNGQEMYLHGIPDLDYIAYEIHAFREKDAKYIADFPAKEFLDSMVLCGSVRDEAYEKSGGFFHTVVIEISADDQQSAVSVLERRKSTKNLDANVYKIDPDAPNQFKSQYCCGFLWESAKASANVDYLRFYFLDKNDVVIVRPVELTKDLDENKVPMVVEKSDKSEFRMFFASVKEKSSNE